MFTLLITLRNKLFKYFGITIYDDSPDVNDIANSFLIDRKDVLLNAIKSRRETFLQLPNDCNTNVALAYYKELEKYNVDTDMLLPRTVGDLYKQESYNDIVDSLQYAINTKVMEPRKHYAEVYW